MSTQPTDAEIARDVRNAADALNHRFGRTTAYSAICRATEGALDSVDPITNSATAVVAVDFFRTLLNDILAGTYHHEELCTEECCACKDSDGQAPEAADGDAATEAGDPAAEEDITPEDALAGLLVSALLKVLAPDDDSEASTPDDK